MTDSNGWVEHKRLVEATLADHSKQLTNIWKGLTDVRIRMGKMEVKITGVLIAAMVISTAVSTALARWLGP